MTAREKMAALHPLNLPTAIRPGRYRLVADLDTRLRRASGAPARRDGLAHPAAAFVLALGGAGEAIDALLARLGYDIACAPLLATCSITCMAALRVDNTYDVSGEVCAVTRKPSRRFGAADHLHLRYVLSHTGRPAVRVDIVMIIRAVGNE